MRRGDLVTVAVPGDFGKPRPALIIQSDLFAATMTITLLPLSGTVVDAPLVRLTVEPSPTNGLQKTSQIMVDKVMTVMRAQVGDPFGRLEDDSMLSVTRALTLFLGFSSR